MSLSPAAMCCLQEITLYVFMKIFKRQSNSLSIIQSVNLVFQGLREELHRKESEVRSVVSQAEELAQTQTPTKNEKKASQDAASKDDSAQQFQKLKSSAADLKIRFDMVCFFTVLHMI